MDSKEPEVKAHKPKKHKQGRIWLYILGFFVLIIILAHIFLPRIILNYVNKTLTEIKGYNGHVEDIDLHILRGAYTIKGLTLVKTSGEVPVPFIDVRKIDISIEWKQLIKGRIVGKLKFMDPKVNFVNGPTEAQSQTSADTSWTDVVDKWVPMKINSLEVQNGEIHYRDYHSQPEIDLVLNEVNGVAENLSNKKRAKNDSLLSSTISVTAKAYQEGTFSLKMKLDPLAEKPTFDLNTELKNLNLVRMNNFFEAYAGFDVEKGNFDVFMEMASKDGAYVGYVKPLMRDFKVLDIQKDKNKPLKLIWETIVAGVATIFTNLPKDQLATKVPFSGNFKSSHVDLWTTIGTLLRNAFIKALSPSIDNSINIDKVQVEEKGNSSLKEIKAQDKKDKKAEKKDKKKKK